MIRRAQEKEMVAIGFADHCTPDPVPGCPFYDWQRPHILDAFRAEIAQVTDKADIEILVGVEADYTLAGQACLNPAVLSQVDHVICAASHFHLPGASRPTSDDPRGKAELMLRMAREALVLPGVSVWAHPFACGKMRPLLLIMETVGSDELAALIRLANGCEVAIELNGGAARHEEYRLATAHFFCLAREMGARFAITSDAHHPADLDRGTWPWSGHTQWDFATRICSPRRNCEKNTGEKRRGPFYRRLACIDHPTGRGRSDQRSCRPSTRGLFDRRWRRRLLCVWWHRRRYPAASGRPEADGRSGD